MSSITRGGVPGGPSARGPRRMRFGPYRDVPLWRVPTGHLELVAALLRACPLRYALEDELLLREGADGNPLRAEDRVA